MHMSYDDVIHSLSRRSQDAALEVWTKRLNQIWKASPSTFRQAETDEVQDWLTSDNSNVHTRLAQTLTVISSLLALIFGTSTSTPSHQHFLYGLK